MIRLLSYFLALLVIGQYSYLECQGFVSSPCSFATNRRRLQSTSLPMKRVLLYAAADNNNNNNNNIENDDNENDDSKAKKSLEEKMKAWEATEEEVRAATLGGVVPGRSDAFDIGLYIAFPLMVLSGLAFALFPFIMGSLDVDGVGPPPTV